MDRRAFFSFLPLAPVIAGAAIAEESNKDLKPTGSVPTLSLHQSTKWNGNRVDLSIGKDGKLWIRSTGEDWKRVVTE